MRAAPGTAQRAEGVVAKGEMGVDKTSNICFLGVLSHFAGKPARLSGMRDVRVEFVLETQELCCLILKILCFDVVIFLKK